MRLFKARDIKRSNPKLTIPGGWVVKIPSIKLDQMEQGAYVSYLRTTRGLPAQVAEARVKNAMQKIFDRGWLIGLRDMLLTRADEYIAIFGTLEGFDPETLQAAYVPGENVGRAGKPIVRRLLLKMGKNAGLTPGSKSESGGST